MSNTKIFSCLVGSHNYNLNDENSDKDYKVFTMPSFKDLYYNHMDSKMSVGETEDFDTHDVRKLGQLLWKSNVNYMEILFSNEIIWHQEHSPLRVLFLPEIRNKIAKMNLPYLYKSCKGMYYNKMKYIHKGTSGTQHLVEKYGYDTKQALHAFRILDFCFKYAENGFSDFKEAITYDNSEREFMLSIKSGYFTFPQFEQMIERKFVNQFLPLEETFFAQKENEFTKLLLEAAIYNAVYDGIQKEVMGVERYEQGCKEERQ
ncbi:hypothetical protein QB910_000068 [Dabrowskivirus KKP3916]|uniref:Nucleotidyltransferase n=1 Tax=Alicyclobacillus phage KKP_3916 TaxID=3040651 RepID=A0AAT9V8R8_9CAUD|nr:hypothetical protein QB910_000068 [Alicyclobacillus phage KKP 3916]